MKKTNRTLVGLAAILTMTAGCAPVLIGGATVVGGAITKEKGLGGTVEDTKISTQLKLALYQKDPDLHAHVNVSVQISEVMLTGAVPTNEQHLDALKITWEIPGVQRVIDNISISKGANVGMYVKDTWITTQIKSAMLFHSNIYSLNYSVKTVSGIVYLMGISRTQEELELVTNIARKTDGVSLVISYVKLTS